MQSTVLSLSTSPRQLSLPISSREHAAESSSTFGEIRSKGASSPASVDVEADTSEVAVDREVPPAARRKDDGSVSNRFAGQYPSLPFASPDLVGDRPAVERTWRLPQSNLALSPVAQAALPDIGVARTTLIVVLFLCFDSCKYMLDRWSLHNRPVVLVQSYVVTSSLLAVLSGLIVSATLEGQAGLRTLIVPRELMRSLPIAVCFSLGQATLAHAFGVGIGAATAFALGFLYMPMCALISRWVFRRAYGWLETYALVLITLSALTFTELHSRVVGFEHGSNGIPLVVLSAVFSCAGALLSEWVLKPKYTPDASAHTYCLQKTRVDFWGLMTSIIILVSARPTDFWNVFQEWDYRLVIACVVRVIQGWLSGLLAKHLSTVAKAVIQCLSLLVIYFVGDVVLLHLALNKLVLKDGLATCLLAIVIALSAFLYQLGRRRTMKALKISTTQKNRHVRSFTRAMTDPVGNRPPTLLRTLSEPLEAYEPALPPEIPLLAPNEFDFDESGADRLPQCLPVIPALERLNLIDRSWLSEARVYNVRLAAWIASRRGLMSQLACVAAFILSDSSRTISYGLSISGTPVVPQSLVIAMSALSVVIGLLVSLMRGGVPELVVALSPREALRCLPVAACFSVGQTFQLIAYSSGISAVQNTVIGYAYMPLSALLSRVIFNRAYNNLEWLSLALLVMSASVFVLLQNGNSQGSTPIIGVICVLLSVALSCIGSLAAEKMMKSGTSPFYIQKVYLEVGGLITAAIMLFVVGVLSNRPSDAVWKERDVGGGHMAAGLFVGWSPQTIIALITTLLQSWLGGLVAKRLSTVIRAVAQCLSLLIIYFVGDLVLNRKAFDWPVGVMALVVAFTVQVFAQSGRQQVTPSSARTQSLRDVNISEE